MSRATAAARVTAGPSGATAASSRPPAGAAGVPGAASGTTGPPLATAEASPRSARLGAWAELLRLPALFTVPGDALAGAAAAGVRPGPRTLLAIGSSLCLYEAGMALNDWADRAEDAAERPHRPSRPAVSAPPRPSPPPGRSPAPAWHWRPVRDVPPSRSRRRWRPPSGPTTSP